MPPIKTIVKWRLNYFYPHLRSKNPAAVSSGPLQAKVRLMHYRLYLPDDFPQLYAIERECFQPPFRFSRRYMQQLIANPNSATWISESGPSESNPVNSNPQITGFGIIELANECTQTIAYIQTLEVAPSHRRQGIATELLTRLESSATAAGAQLLWLHVAETNTPAIAHYQAHGYEPQGREENYYAPNLHALTYFKLID